MTPATIEELRAKHDRDLDTNRRLGIHESSSGEELSEQVHEVLDGYKTVWADGEDGKRRPVRLGPGQRFRPTKNQVENGSLENKSRELTQSEYDALGKGARRARAPGADFDEMRVKALGDVQMAEGTRELAIEGGLSHTDFEGLEPGWMDQFTRAQVEALIASKKKAE